MTISPSFCHLGYSKEEGSPEYGSLHELKKRVTEKKELHGEEKVSEAQRAPLDSAEH